MSPRLRGYGRRIATPVIGEGQPQASSILSSSLLIFPVLACHITTLPFYILSAVQSSYRVETQLPLLSFLPPSHLRSVDRLVSIPPRNGPSPNEKHIYLTLMRLLSCSLHRLPNVISPLRPPLHTMSCRLSFFTPRSGTILTDVCTSAESSQAQVWSSVPLAPPDSYVRT